ncbi:MAG: EmrB/QacA family drug resistance transporter, partial [Gemmatimonadales bacterium]
QNAVDPRDMGAATSSATFFRSLGGSIGTALFGAIFTSRLTAGLAGLGGAAAGGEGLVRSPQAVAALPPEIKARVIEAVAEGVDTVFITAVPFMVLAFFLVLKLPELPLRDHAHVGSVQLEG